MGARIGTTKCEVLSDLQVLVDAVCDSSDGASEFNVIVINIRHILVSNCNFEVKFIQRQADIVVHNLTRAIFYASHQVFDFVPPCILSLLINKMS